MDMGNMSLLCLVDSSNRRDFEMLHEIMWSALDFFGMPYEVFDLAKNNLSFGELKDHSTIVIGQEHLGKSLSEDETKYIIDAVAEGAGLVVFDGDIHQYRDPLKEALGLKTTEEPTHMPHLTTDMIRVLDNSHYITAGRGLEFIRFNSPVQVGNVVSIEREHKILAILANGSGCPALITEAYGRGRVALFTLSPKIWLNEYFGHGGGLDHLFWKSIVWAAKKPFIMLAIPPFVTIRIDDCSGANNFEWVKTLNKHGFIPHVSLFTDNIGDGGAKVIKELYDAGLAEFSAHAFTWTKQIYWKPKSPTDHNSGEEYSEDELKQFFEILDNLACKWGIKWSKVLTAHFGEVGRNVLPFLTERGVTYLAMPYAFSIPYGKSPLELQREKMKRLKPFGGQGGVIDRHPDNTEFFIAAPSYWNIPKSMLQLLVDKAVIAPQGQIYDFLWETARVKVDVELAAWYAAFGIKLCLDNLSFVVLVTHEQNISVLNGQEWDNLLTRVDKLTSKYEKIYKSWSYIAEYAQNLYNSKLTYADYDVDTGEVRCRLKGKSSMPLYLHVFKSKYYWIERDFKEVPAFEGEITINFKPENLLSASSAVSK